MNRSVDIGDTRTDNLDLASVISGDILRRAGLVAIVIGSVLTLVNQPGAIFGGAEFKYVPLALSYLTPFVVVTISQVLGAQQAMADARQNGKHGLDEEQVWASAIAHGIPLRALVVGGVAGSFNAIVLIVIALLEGARINGLSAAQLAQPFLLATLFGLLSQTIAYRRTAQALQAETKQRTLGAPPAAILSQERSGS